MSLILSSCVEYHDKRKVCVASEFGKTYTLNNTSNYRIRKVKVDKCLLQKEGEKRCDYLFHLDNNEGQRAIFIEFKGGATTDAVKQLYDTVIYLKNELANCQLNVRIVGTRDTPNIENSPHYRKLMREIEFPKGTIKRATNRVLIENI